MYTNLNGPFSMLMTGKSMTNVVSLLSKLLVFIMTWSSLPISYDAKMTGSAFLL